MGLLLLILVIGILILIVGVQSNPDSRYSSIFDNPINPYQAKNPLTRTEVQFYERLTSALPEYVILAQVQLSRFIEVDAIKVPGQYYKWFNPIAQQSVDYLVCTKAFSIVTAIELDDKSHQSIDAQARDSKKTKNLYAAKVPLIRWHAENMPSQSQIQLEIEQIAKFGNQESPVLDFEPRTELFKKPDPYPPALKFGAFLVFVVVIGFALRQLPSVLSTSIRAVTPVVQDYNQRLLKNVLDEQLARQQATAEKLRQQQAAEEQLKRQQIEAQQAAIKAQSDAQQAQADEAIRKEKAWEKYYARSSECDRPENSVRCGNEYIRAKKRFESYWETHKS